MRHRHPHILCLLPLHISDCSSSSLSECPNVRELHLELDEVSQLLDVSKDQYDEILSIVQRHTDETVDWLSNMAAEFGWVGQVVSNSSNSGSIFRIGMVRRKRPFSGIQVRKCTFSRLKSTA